ncbi:hypothetical protein BD626DRAFT_581870 [Schizophyllum amplum]|uniref:Uncharacterized protein n=1 Tax=Schizophyllum amplum TaxID=97359 RepID=A0A550CR69_9AGAR|nr:hypothetical protein BD626DRAFT_581870 [Auriculariopsis ampla]
MSSQPERQTIRKCHLNFILDSPVPSSQPQPRSQPNSDIPSASTPHVVQYEYIGRQISNGRNVLQRVEMLTADIRVSSFDTHLIVCAGCNKQMSTRGHTSLYYDNCDNWNFHQRTCGKLQDWYNPSSPYRLTPEMAAKFERSRMESRERALAYLVLQDKIKRV